MASLGPNESFYLELVRDGWKPIPQRREIRQAFAATALGLFIVGAGIVAIVLAGLPDIGPAFLGIFVLAWGGSTLWKQRAAFRAWRLIGHVRVEFPDGALVAGVASQLDVVLVPRRGGEVRTATLTLWATDSRGPAAIGDPYRNGVAFDVDVPQPATLVARQELRLPVVIAVEPTAPASRFERDFTRQWFLLARVELADGRTWEREYPIVVYPARP
jgi:hypothetical protein